ADLAALAGAARIGIADDVCEAARDIAARNGGELAACSADLAADGRCGRVDVQVRVEARIAVAGRVFATAAASAERLPG
ncbi:MAG: hypothetical protein LBQ06_00605, partial [Frankiaceae bacterium]|nr:hypothetical protein [Frankiaceae bacterium]